MYLFTLMTQSQFLSLNFHRKLFDLYADFLRFNAEKVEYSYFIVSKMFAFSGTKLNSTFFLFGKVSDPCVRIHIPLTW